MKERNIAMMDGLVPVQANDRFAQAIHLMVQDLINEGFDEEDVLEFLRAKTQIGFDQAVQVIEK